MFSNLHLSLDSLVLEDYNTLNCTYVCTYIYINMLHACLLHPPSFLDELQQVVPHVLKDKVKFVVLPDDLLELDQVGVLDLHQGLGGGGEVEAVVTVTNVVNLHCSYSQKKGYLCT